MQKPIGYWLKTLDLLIDENFDHALAAEGVQRRHWQILNIVKTSPATKATIAAALDPFWTEGAITLDDIRERANLREKIMAGLTAEQYTQTVAVLERMAANLTPA